MAQIFPWKMLVDCCEPGAAHSIWIVLTDREHALVYMLEPRVGEPQESLIGQPETVAHPDLHEERGDLWRQLGAVESNDRVREDLRSSHVRAAPGIVIARPRGRRVGSSMSFASAISRHRVGSP